MRKTEQLVEESSDYFAATKMKKFMITVLGRSVSSEQSSVVRDVILQHGFAIDSAEYLLPPACLTKLSTAYACLRITASGNSDEEQLRLAFLDLGHEQHLDIVIESESTYGRERRLIALDMDSTLIGIEVIDQLAKLAGVGEQVSRITESAMRGEIDFKQSFTRRLSLLRGLPESKVRELLASIPLTDGAEVLIAGVKELGYRTAILSGGFTFVGKHLKARLGIDHMFANELEIVDGMVTGRVSGGIVDGQRKKELLQAIAGEERIPLEQLVAVGDGANDLPMLGVSGMGIAFHAKPIVRREARFAISSLGLDAILYLLSPGPVCRD
jgi:phosphoserine phosphatase